MGIMVLGTCKVGSELSEERLDEVTGPQHQEPLKKASWQEAAVRVTKF